MSQEAFGEELGKLLGKPWPRQAMSHAERGRRNFTAAEIVALSVVIGCEVAELFRLPLDVEALQMPGETLTRAQLIEAGQNVPGPDVVELRRRLAELAKSAERARDTTADVDRDAHQVYADLDRLLTGITRPQEA